MRTLLPLQPPVLSQNNAFFTLSSGRRRMWTPAYPGYLFSQLFVKKVEHHWVREATIAYLELMYLRAPVAREKGNERSRGKGPRQGEIRRHSESEICHFIFGISVSHDRVAFGAALWLQSCQEPEAGELSSCGWSRGKQGILKPGSWRINLWLGNCAERGWWVRWDWWEKFLVQEERDGI